jgi:hypothetical protein
MLLSTQGGAINLTAQRDVMMSDDNVTARKKEADKRGPAQRVPVGAVDALAPASAHSARSTGHDDEHEPDDHSNRGASQRRKKRSRVPPAFKP